jgi:hypothetical protein
MMTISVETRIALMTWKVIINFKKSVNFEFLTQVCMWDGDWEVKIRDMKQDAAVQYLPHRSPSRLE